ncbi:MAG: alpha/beta fold hydrolase [Saprospiraceae bacterium]
MIKLNDMETKPSINQPIEIVKAPENYKSKPIKELALPPTVKIIRFFFKNISPIFPRFFGKIGWELFQKPFIRAKHRRTDELLESAEKFQLIHNNHIIKGYSWGKGAQIVLLVHGWESRGTAMRAFVPHLLKKGFRVVTFDGPAHGSSSGKKINPFLFAQTITKMVDTLGSVHSIIGHSFGGFSTAITLSIVSPHIKVERLVLMAAFSNTLSPIGEFQKFLGFGDKVLNNILDAAHREIKIDPLKADFRIVEKPNNVKKALIVQDLNDDVVAYQNGLDFYKNWKDTKMIQTEGFGHFRILKETPVIEKVVDFITS